MKQITGLLRFVGGALLVLLLWSDVQAQYQLTPLDLEPPYLPQRTDRLSASTDGFYWIGGSRGLFRFTGEGIEEVSLKDAKGNTSKDKIIQSEMIEDDTGKLWFSTYSVLYRYDPISDQISTHSIEANGLPLKAGYRPFFFDDLKQELWLRAGDRLWAYQVHTANHRPISGPSSAIHYSVLPLKDGHYRIYGSRWMYPGLEIIDVQQGKAPVEATEVLQMQKVVCTLPLSVDSLLIGTQEGLKLLDLRNNPLTLTAFSADTLRTDVSSLARLDNGHIMISFVGQGIAEMDPQTGQILAFLDQQQDVNAVHPDQMVTDGQGQILSSQLKTGFLLIEHMTGAFRNPVAGVKSPTRQLDIDKNGNVYLLQGDGLLWQRSPSGKLTNLMAKIPSENLPKTGALAMKADSILVLGSSNFWVISPNGKKRFTHTEDFIDRLLVQPGEPPLMITGQGVASIEFRDEKLLLTPIANLSSSAQSINRNLHPLRDKEFLLNRLPNALWLISSAETGYQIKKQIGSIGEIYCVAQRQNGKIYAGGSEGLFLLDEAGAREISIKTGLLGDHDIQSIIEDKTGNLWLGTNAGLLSYRPEDKSVFYFSQTDGLPSDQFKATPPITLPNGEIWMATDAGVVAFQPEELLKREQHREPYIAKIWTNEEPLESDTSSHYLKRLELNYLRNTLKFKVAAKGFGRSAASGIQYQMLGYEDKPAYTDFNTTIRYPNLPPGEYTLRLTAINQNGRPSGVRELAVIIHPPFNQTLTFKALVGLGLLLLIGGGYVILLRRERIRQHRIRDQQARLAAERDRIAGEVHDDLGGQLSSIMYLSEELLLTEAAPGTERELNRINELSRNSLQNVRDIIFALDNRRSSVADLSEQFRAGGMEFFADHKLGFQYEEALQRPEFELTSRQKRNLLSIVKEAWHNTAKHASASEVMVRLEQSHEALELVIVDNGRGFSKPDEHRGTGGYGLGNMHEKAASIGGQLSIDSAPGKGTRLKLSVPLEPKS